MKSARPLVTLSIPLLVCGCVSLTPAALIEMSRFDPLGFDAKNTMIAVITDENVRIGHRSAHMIISYQMPNDGDFWVREDIPFDLASNHEIRNSPQPATGEQIQIAKLSTENASRLTLAQNRIKRLKSQGTDGAGQLTLHVAEICHIGERPDEINYRLYLRSRENGTFVQMTTDQDFMELFRKSEKDVRVTLRECTPEEM